MEEVTDLTYRDTTRILTEALEGMSPMDRQVANVEHMCGGSTFIDIGRVAVMDLAAQILRKGGWKRADAVEMAFDSLLVAGNGRQWERTGEVVLLKYEQVARALCQRKE